MKVYADNAATTKVRPEALDAYVKTSQTLFGNPSSLHSEGQRAKELLEGCRARIAAIAGIIGKNAAAIASVTKKLTNRFVSCFVIF